MPSVRYQENTREHTFRLGVPPFFTRIRRRVLAAKLEGRPLPHDTPTHLHDATPQALMATLAVKPLDGNGDARKNTILLIPTATPATQDRRQGQISRRRQRLAAGKPPPPPYGYHRTRKEAIAPDPNAAPTIQLAFTLILAFLAEGERSPWRHVATELNAAGHVRQNGKPWTHEHVRALAQTPLYAGYARTNQQGLSDAVERAANIEQPLVDIHTFVRAARRAHRRQPRWLDELASLAIADAKQQQRTRKVA